MQLLAESGGSKTAWYLFDETGLLAQHRSSGMNPNAQSAAEILAQQKAEWPAELQIPPKTTLHFYGAGLGAAKTEAQMREVLNGLFPAIELHLQSDMLAAAKATCGDTTGIVCILGTGSNCCWYENGEITATMGSHGYLFNDEGGGADLGRALIGAALNHELPHNIEHDFRNWAGKSFLDIRTEIYQAPKINVALAHYSRFLAKNIAEPTLRALVQRRFMAFFEKTVLRMRKHRETPLHFAGSIAAVYADILKESLGLLGLEAGSILAEPGDALLEYHLNLLKSSKA